MRLSYDWMFYKIDPKPKGYLQKSYNWILFLFYTSVVNFKTTSNQVKYNGMFYNINVYFLLYLRWKTTLLEADRR